MIDFLVKPFFLRRELATKRRFEKCLRDRYPNVLAEAREFCTLIRDSEEYKKAKRSYDDYSHSSYCATVSYLHKDNAWSCYEDFKAEETKKEAICVQNYNALIARFSFDSVVDAYRNLVKEIVYHTSYDPSKIMLYSDHVHRGYDKDKQWLYVGYWGYSEKFFIEYCTTYDLMCLIGDYCAFSRCGNLSHLREDDYIKSPYKDLNAKTSEEAYKEARKMLSEMYELEDGK